MLIETLETGDKVHKYQRCLVAVFNGKRRVMSTSMHNGGYREDLTAVFNHDVNPGPGMPCDYCKEGDESRKRFIIDELGLDYDTVAYMATIVSMDNAVIRTETYDELTVTAIATASVEVNGGRVGEKATSYEKRGQSVSLRPGTINIMVLTNADMTPGCMARAMITATEAKTAALQEMMAGSLRSSGIATGTGTDNMIIVANAESDNLLTYAGKHGKLGELIGVTVMSAVKQSLRQHSCLTEQGQHSMLARLRRFGIDECSFKYVPDETNIRETITKASFINELHQLDRNSEVVAMTSLYVHLMDQVNWGLLTASEAASAGEILLRRIMESQCCPWEDRAIPDNDQVSSIRWMLDRFTTAISAAALSNLELKEDKR
jgi:adenosylcobinamide amidohydrolase